MTQRKSCMLRAEILAGFGGIKPVVEGHAATSDCRGAACCAFRAGQALPLQTLDSCLYLKVHAHYAGLSYSVVTDRSWRFAGMTWKGPLTEFGIFHTLIIIQRNLLLNTICASLRPLRSPR
jgi:hypothetical protein